MGQKPAHPCIDFVCNNDRLGEMFADSSIDIKSAFLVSNSTMQVNYEKKEAFIRDSRKQSPIINALICAKSRIYLYKAIRTVTAKSIELLYCDTGKLISE